LEAGTCARRLVLFVSRLAVVKNRQAHQCLAPGPRPDIQCAAAGALGVGVDGCENVEQAGLRFGLLDAVWPWVVVIISGSGRTGAIDNAMDCCSFSLRARLFIIYNNIFLYGLGLCVYYLYIMSSKELLMSTSNPHKSS